VKRATSALPADSPREVAGFRIQRLLGGGSSTRVYLAEHPLRHRLVAVKLVLADLQADVDSLEELLVAVQRARGMTHPNLERLIEVQRGADSVQIVSEYLPGGSLRQRIEAEGALPAARALNLLRQVLAGLSALHARGLVHRDVKPGNVLFDGEGRAVLVDFGLLQPVRAASEPGPADTVLAPALGTGSSRAGQIAGTPAYMAPEQARGERVDARADLYSLGVTAFEMLSGRLPYAGADPLTLAELHERAPVPELPRAVDWLQPLIDALMAKRVEERLDSARAVLDVIETLVLAEPAAADIAPRSTSRLLSAPRHAGARRWMRYALAGTGVLALAMLLVLLLR
jgi:serine/threonine-protein kinase PpkA